MSALPHLVLPLGVVLLAASGCGSDADLPPAAEPATSPPPERRPAGRVVELGGELEGLAADPRSGLVAAASRDPDRITLVDGRSGEVRERVRVPESARHLSLAAPGGPVLAPAERSDQLIRLTLPRGEVGAVGVGDFPHDAARAAGRTFVADEGGDTLTVLEGEDAVATLPAPIQPGGVAARGDLVAAVAVAERVLRIYDARALEAVGQAGAGVGPTHVVAGADDRFYVVDTLGDAILVFRAEPGPRLVDRTNVSGSPYGIAIDPRRGRLWVTATERNLVIELALGELAPQRLRSFATVRQPNSVAVDPRTGLVFVAARHDGELQIIDPKRDREAG